MTEQLPPTDPATARIAAELHDLTPTQQETLIENLMRGISHPKEIEEFPQPDQKPDVTRPSYYPR